MKHYAPVARPFAFNSRQEKSEFFFVPQPFFKNHVSWEKLQLKWFAPNTGGYFLLSIQGLDARMVKELVLLLRTKAHLNLDDCQAETLSDMMGSMAELAERPQFTLLSNEDGGREYLRAVDEKIEENLSNDLFRGSDLAKLLCCCEMQLYRKIKQLTKLSTANYIRRYRLRRSLDSLHEGDQSISEISFNMGFHSLEYFSRSFKKEFGICPSAFRSGQNVEIVQTNV